MILFTRVEARDFHTLFARCVVGRPRGPAPPVVISIRHGTARIASTTLDGVTLTLTTPASDQRDGFVVLAASVLTEVGNGGSAGSTNEIVTLQRQSSERGLVHWPGGGPGRTYPVELIQPGQEYEIPAVPAVSPIAAELLLALHECGRSSRSSAEDRGRFTLSTIQLQGKVGRIVATDGKSALLWSGFTLPFRDDVLVPALPVFGENPLARITDVRIGRTPTHLVVVAGAWSVSLPIDSQSRYPDVDSVIPKHPATIARIDGQDAIELQKLLPALPGGDEENRAVTISASGTVKILAQDLATRAIRELTLHRSRTTGPPVRVALDRRQLARALALGCHTWKLSPDKPVVAEGESVTLVIAPLDPLQMISSTAASRLSPLDDSASTHPGPLPTGT